MKRIVNVEPLRRGKRQRANNKNVEIFPSQKRQKLNDNNYKSINDEEWSNYESECDTDDRLNEIKINNERRSYHYVGFYEASVARNVFREEVVSMTECSDDDNINSNNKRIYNKENDPYTNNTDVEDATEEYSIYVTAKKEKTCG